MARKRATAGITVPDLAEQHCREGYLVLARHPMFAPLVLHTLRVRRQVDACPPEGWALVTSTGELHVRPTRRARPEEWQCVFAHCLLHLGLGHVQQRPRQREWYVACDYVINGWLVEMRLGDILEPRAPDWWMTGDGLELDDFYRRCLSQGCWPTKYRIAATCRPAGRDPSPEPAAHFLGCRPHPLVRRSVRAAGPGSAPTHAQAVVRPPRRTSRGRASRRLPGSKTSAPSACCWTLQGRWTASSLPRRSAPLPPTASPAISRRCASSLLLPLYCHTRTDGPDDATA